MRILVDKHVDERQEGLNNITFRLLTRLFSFVNAPGRYFHCCFNPFSSGFRQATLGPLGVAWVSCHLCYLTSLAHENEAMLEITLRLGSRHLGVAASVHGDGRANPRILHRNYD